MTNKPVRKAIFPIAGMGTRFLPATKAIPKEMMTLVDRPLIQHALEEARAAGIEEFIFVTARGKTALEDHFDSRPDLEQALRAAGKMDLLTAVESTNLKSGAVAYVRQNDPLGLAHAIWCARRMVGNEPTAVILPDDVFFGTPAMVELQEAWVSGAQGCVIAASYVPKETIGAYGCLSIGPVESNTATISGIVEKPHPNVAPSNVAITGRYIIGPEVMQAIDTLISGHNGIGEVQFTDALMMGSKGQGKAVFVSAERYDCGSKLGFLQANLAFGLARPEFREGLLLQLEKERKRYA